MSYDVEWILSMIFRLIFFNFFVEYCSLSLQVNGTCSNLLSSKVRIAKLKMQLLNYS